MPWTDAMPFSALHPTPSRLTSTASSAATAATDRTAATTATSSSSSSSAMMSGENNSSAAAIMPCKSLSAADGNHNENNNDDDDYNDDDDDFVNISAMDAAAHDSSKNEDDDEEDDRKPAAKPDAPSSPDHDMCIQNSDQNEQDNLLKSTTSSSKTTTNINNNNKDNRFLCAICLETVSDEPVVTRCGHLYCWPCLYQWLQPGMLLSEYHAAFGGNSMPGNSAMNAGHGSSSSGGGLNFLSSGMTSGDAPRMFQFQDRPYNPLGGRYNEQRRCCPVCKAGCTVDSVIPIYIHVHSNTNSASPIGGRNDISGNRQSVVSMDSLDVDNLSAAREEQSTSTSMFAAAASANSGGDVDVTFTPRGSPRDANSTNNYFVDDDPTNANLGLRQRLRGAANGRENDTSGSFDTQQYNISSPTRNQDILSGFDNNLSHHQNANGAAIDGNGTNVNLSIHSTPVHRNSSSSVIRDSNRESGNNATSIPNLPSRPVPTSPWVMNPQQNQHQQSQQPQQHHRSQHDHTFQPNLSNSDDQTAQPSHAPAIPSSSPFRLALRPRHHNAQSWTAPAAPQQTQQDHFNNNFHAYSNNRHRHGRLTSALLGIVDTIDNHLASTPHRGSASNTEQGTEISASAAAAAVAEVPQLHRSDGGLGGIGRASEWQQNSRQQDNGSGSGGANNDMMGNGRMMMSEEESSLAMAREFLSRLLLMLACFVILCLLLF